MKATVIAGLGTVVDRFDDERTGNDDVEQRVRAALRARADSAFRDLGPVPAMSEPLGPDPQPASGSPRRHRLAWTAAIVLAAAAVACAVIVPIAWFRHDSSNQGTGRVDTRSSSPAVAPTPHSTAPTTPPASTKPPVRPRVIVKVTSDLTDGETVGVGEPIVLNFSPAPTDSSAFTKAAVVTVNGKRATGAWYWEKPYADQPIEAHYREAGYWPADSTIKVALPIGGLSAGPGRAYARALTSVTFHTGDAHISTVDGANLRMTVTSNGHVVNTVPVSLGAAATPTYNGVKVVMQKGEDIRGTNSLRPNGTVLMNGPGYSDDPVPWSVRVTASGEYVHAAGWNTHIGTRSTSNGCTNLKPGDGKWFYRFSQLGDVVRYVNVSDGSAMNPLDGLGDWNIPWEQWTQGGRLANH